MRIAVFDIDGTLTDTNAVDLECYEAAVRLETGLDIPSDWPRLGDVTDATILAAAFERQGIAAPEFQAFERAAERVGELLAKAFAEAPERFRPIAGAPEIFAVLQRAGWNVAIATGAWRSSALVKLRGAGIPHEGVPLASASDHSARADIIQHAVRAITATPDAVVYLGDGVWDGRAAKALGYAFVGVGRTADAEALRSVGAGAVIPDFADARSVLEELERLTR